MNYRVKNATGVMMVVSGMSAFAQDNPPAPASSASTSPPPPPPPNIATPGDPTWFVVGFVAGLVVGYVAAKMFAGPKAIPSL